MPPRSVRNSNPGNLRVGQQWQGLLPRSEMNAEQRAETEFCVFRDPAYGFRALAKLLHNYQIMYGLSTVRKIINRFAPKSENDTDAYVRAVTEHMGKSDPDSEVDLNARLPLYLLCQGIAIHETGGWDGYWTNEQLADGLDLAGF